MTVNFDASSLWHSLIFNYSYNSSIVSMALIAQGLVAGILGGLLLFRRKSLLTDALSHSTLPGVAIGFLISHFLLGGEREEWVILLSAFVMMLLCLATIKMLSKHIRQDAALALTLSGFYAMGIVLLSYIQIIPSGTKAGLENFILGQSATINSTEVLVIACGALVVFLSYILLYKEWKMLCFDQHYASAKGYNINLLDFMITTLACVVIAIGIRATGLILIMGLMTIPALAATLLAKRWNVFLLIAATIGAISSHVGASISAAMEGIPTGSAVIMICMLFYIVAFSIRRFGNFA